MNKEYLIDTITIVNHYTEAFHYSTGVLLTIKDIEEGYEMEDGDTVPTMVDVEALYPLTEVYYKEISKLEKRLLEDYDILLNVVNVDFE